MDPVGGRARISRTSAVGALAVAVLMTSIANAGLVEGFEDLGKVSVSDGKLTPIKAGEGVTEGKQAAQVPAGADISITVTGEQLGSADWLRIDTLGADPVAYSVGIAFTGPVTYKTVAYVQPGKDTIAMPLSRVRRGGSEWPAEGATLQLKNLSKSALIVDNVRLERVAEPPEDAVLLDFGPYDQLVWPGFKGAATSDRIGWASGGGLQTHSPGYPDMLTGDFVGPLLKYKQTSSFDLVAFAGRPSVVWLWVTHYAPGYSQPSECTLKCNNAVVFQRRPNPSSLLGAVGCLEGKDGDWTPKWFCDVHAPSFVELVKVSLSSGKGKFEAANCQLAALAMVPIGQHDAMQAYVKKVSDDLSRYRRQFVVGQRKDNLCELAPTEDEMRAGVMIFQPPGGTDFPVDWSPDDTSRVKAINIKTVNGGRAMACVAVAPINRCDHLSATLGNLRTDKGQALDVSLGKAEVALLETVPRVFDGRVEFHPWIMTRRISSVKPRELAFIIISVQTRSDAAAGAYKSSLQLDLGGTPVAVPLAIEVTDIGRPAGLDVAIGAVTGADVLGAQRAFAALQQPSQRAGPTLQVRQKLMTDGLDAMLLPGPSLNIDLSITAESLTSEMRAYPASRASGPTLLNVESLGSALAPTSWSPGSEFYKAGVGRIVDKATSVVGHKLAGGAYFYHGDVSAFSALAKQSDVALAVRAAGGKTAAMISSASLARGDPADAAKMLSAFSAVILRPGSKDLHKHIAAFKKRDKDRKAYVLVTRPERFFAGFYARALGADGCFLEGVFMDSGGPYSGFHFPGKALIVPQPGASFALTLAMARLRQGKDDYLLMARAEGLLARAKAVKQPREALKNAIGDLENVLDNIRSKAEEYDDSYDVRALRTKAVEAATLESWRNSLIKACGDATEALKGGGGASIHLPGKQEDKRGKAHSMPLVIHITAKGQIEIGKQPYSREKLAEMLEDVAKNDPERQILIRPDHQAAMKDFADLVKLMRKAGIKEGKIVYAPQPAESPPAPAPANR